MMRPTFKDFKEKTLNNPAVREEYDAQQALRHFLEKRLAEANRGELSTKCITEIAAEEIKAG